MAENGAGAGEADRSSVPAFTLDRLELAAGVVPGGSRADEMAASGPAYRTGREALEAVVAAELTATPCAVSFSGGRDSSAILALATQVARREGLPLPIPVTFRFPDVPLTHESDWQERVIAHLNLPEWERIDLSSELDLLGDIAQGCLRHHGLTWPPNAYLHVPIFEKARGGVVLTGLDGDGLFGDWRWAHAQAVLARRVPFTARDVIRVAFALAPAAVRKAALARRTFFVPDWLTVPAQHEFMDRILERAASEPRRWNRRVVWHERSRALELTRESLRVIGGRYGVRVVHPLLDPRVIRAMGREGGPAGYGDRTSAMRHLFGDLLPVETVERQSKAVFGGAVWGERAREFARTWDGRGLDEGFVIPERLRTHWQAEHPVFHSWTLLHEAWAADPDRIGAGQEK